jgi:uncharacterized protein (DUF427 family)
MRSLASGGAACTRTRACRRLAAESSVDRRASEPMMRSPLALTPGPGQRSVWDFPRPPAIETVSDRVLVEFGGGIIADTIRALRVCETASPPAYYLPFADVAPGVLIPCPGGSFCEWKGRARYWSVVTSSREEKPHLVVPQPGGFYGGWITPEFTGPFKGEPGTTHW